MKLCDCGCGQPVKISVSGPRRGLPNRYLYGHQPIEGRPRLETVKRYRIKRVPEHATSLVHRQRAEKALGRPLKRTELVHHADGSRNEHAQLVICENDAYHMLLHRRMRIKALGGDPNTDLFCSGCKAIKNASEFHRKRTSCTGHNRWCKDCMSAYDERRRAKRRAA